MKICSLLFVKDIQEKKINLLISEKVIIKDLYQNLKTKNFFI